MTDLDGSILWNGWGSRISGVDPELIRSLTVFVLGVISSMVIETGFHVVGYGVVIQFLTIVAALSIMEFMGWLSGWSRAYLLGWVVGVAFCGRFFLPAWKFFVDLGLAGYYVFRAMRSSKDFFV